MDALEEHDFTADGKVNSYLTGGPEDGPLLIFVHGWPAVALTWKAQLAAFAALGFRVVAMDTRGYGSSSHSRNVRQYALESLVSDQLSLLAYLQREAAVWIGHDWGCGIVWALAAHHPEVCVGVVNLCVPYRTLERGLGALVATVNRSIYPAEKYPNGQWDYQVFYEKSHEKATRTLDANIENTIKALSLKSDPSSYGKPAPTAFLTENNGWFNGASQAPDVPLEKTSLSEEILQAMVGGLNKNGFFGATAYYLNHDVNEVYSDTSQNNGLLNMPSLFIHAKFDSVCATSLSRMSEPMRKYCSRLTETSIEAGHWVALEKPTEVNAAIARWLATQLPSYWPHYWSSPFASSPTNL